MLANHLSQPSCNQHMFNNTAVAYQEAMQKSDIERIKVSAFKQPCQTGQNEKKKTKNLWFNPPFSEHVKTNNGKTFLNLLENHFLSRHCLYKICNKNTVKVSHSLW